MQISGKVIPITGEPDMMAALRGNRTSPSKKWGMGDMLNGADTKARDQSESEIIMPEESWDRLAREIRRAAVEFAEARTNQVRAMADLQEKAAALDALAHQWVDGSKAMLPKIDLSDLVEALKTLKNIDGKIGITPTPASDVPNTGPATGEYLD